MSSMGSVTPSVPPKSHSVPNKQTKKNYSAKCRIPYLGCWWGCPRHSHNNTGYCHCPCSTVELEGKIPLGEHITHSNFRTWENRAGTNLLPRTCPAPRPRPSLYALESNLRASGKGLETEEHMQRQTNKRSSNCWYKSPLL